MASEIAKTPKVFRAMVDNKAAIDALKNVKIQETYKISVQGLSSADYLHAPIGLSKVTLTN